MRLVLVTLFQLLFVIVLYCIGIVFFGLSIAPGAYLVINVWGLNSGVHLFLRCVYLGLSLAAAYFLFGLTLVFLVGTVRSILRIRLKEGDYPIFSLGGIKWAFVSSLYLMVNFTFIDFILLTPFASLLQRMLGAKIGKNVQINSKFVFDATLLEIGDNTVVGGGAIIIGHVVERSILKLRKVKIGKNVTIGSHSTIMPGCEIGDRALIGASAVLLKNTKVGEREVWYGIPAEPIKRRENMQATSEEGAK